MIPTAKCLNVRISPELIRRIKQAAFDEGVTMQDWVEEKMLVILDEMDCDDKTMGVK